VHKAVHTVNFLLTVGLQISHRLVSTNFAAKISRTSQLVHLTEGGSVSKEWEAFIVLDLNTNRPEECHSFFFGEA
jgi:hypothetical protein